MVNAMILAPILYIAIIIGTMATFSSLYRKRKALGFATLEPWFPPSTARDVYLSLLHLPDSAPKVPDSVLRAALLRRAVTVIHRAITVRNAKGPLQALLQRSSVGDDTWTQFTQAEAELDAELKEIMEEANSLTPPGQQPPWGQIIFQSAAEMAHNERFMKKAKAQEDRGIELKKWWEDKTGKIRTEFLKSEGIDVEAVGQARMASITPEPPSIPPTTAQDVPQTPAPLPVSSDVPAGEQVEAKTKSPTSSDEDGVLVEAVSTPVRPPPVTQATGSMRGKKKNKK